MVATRIAGRDGRLRGAPETLQTRGASAVAPIAHGWRYAEDGARDSRFDLLRGFAVFAMVVDHIGGASWLYGLTGGNRFFVSAAEGFVFISGMVVGIVYGGVARAHGVRAAIDKLLRRVWLLYILAVWLALGSALIATILGNPVGRPFAQDPARFILETIALRRTFYLVDVLLLYLFAMLAATGALALLQRGWWWAVALGSGALWLAYQFAPTAVQIPWPIADNPVFPFASWQIVFFSGLILGYHQRRLAEWLHTRVPPSPLGDGYVLPLGAAVGALIWLSQTNAAAFNRFAPQRNAAAVLDAWFLKSQLPLPRLLASAIVFGFAWALVTRCWRPLRRACGPFLLVLGRGALYAYAAHLFLVAVVHYAVMSAVGTGSDGGYPALSPAANAALQVGALALLWGLTRHRFLQASLAPLGASPLVRTGPRRGWRIGTRPADSLLLPLLLALVLLPTVLPSSLALQATADTPHSATPATPGAAARLSGDAAGWGIDAGEVGGGSALPESTVTAPRSVAGIVRANRSEPALAPSPTPEADSGSGTPGPSRQPTAGASGTPVATPLAPGYLLDGTFASAALGRVMPYGIYLPPGYDAGTARYPVLYMLHGTGGHYSEWVGYGLADSAERLIATGQIGALIIVFPQGDQSYFVNHTGTDDERWGDYIAFDLVAHIDATYRTIPAREARAIGGLSMGGFGALTLALAHPDIFGAVGAHSPSLRTFEEAPAALAATSADYALIDPAALGQRLAPASTLKVWIDVGNLDVWIDRTTQLKDILRGRGLHPEYRENDGGHDGGYWSRNAESYLRFYDGALTPAHLP